VNKQSTKTMLGAAPTQKTPLAAAPRLVKKSAIKASSKISIKKATVFCGLISSRTHFVENDFFSKSFVK